MKSKQKNPFESLKIESVPIKSKKRKSKYRLNELKVGQSFFIDGRDQENALRSAASRRGKSLGRDFTVQREGPGLRVGRVK